MSFDKIQKIKRAFQRQRALNSMTGPGVHDFVVVLDQLKPNFNIGKTLRSVEAFGGHEVRLVGVDFFNPYPAKGAFIHVPVRFDDAFLETYQSLLQRNYTLYALDPSATESLQTIELPKRSAFIIGHEYKGLSFNLADFPLVKKIRINQFGQTQSLNASVAASIAMYEYTRQHPANQDFESAHTTMTLHDLSEGESETLHSLMSRTPGYVACAEEATPHDQHSRGRYQVIRSGAHTAGLVHFEVFHDRSIAIIHSLRLLEYFQKRGWDRLTYQKLELELRAQGIRTIRIGINPQTQARTSWEDLGFSANGVMGVQRGIQSRYRVVQLEKTLA